MKLRISLNWLAAGVLVACQPASVSAPDEGKPLLTAEGLMALVSETDEPICGLDISGANEGHDVPDSPLGTFTDYLAYAEEVQAGYGDPLKQMYRRAALWRRLQAGAAALAGEVPEKQAQEDVARLADELYGALDDGVPSPVNFADHAAKVGFWNDQIAALNVLRDTEQGEQVDFHVRFCVVNERGGAARAAARAFIVDNAGGTVDLAAPDVLKFVSEQQFFTGPFRGELLKELANPEALDTDTLARLAMLRDRDTTLLPGDPTTAEAFWEARDREIDAVISFLEAEDFATPADELYAMTRMDQSLRHLFSVLPNNKDHFENEEEANLALNGEPEKRNGLGSRFSRVDEFNTARLKDMLKDRDWFQDDLDGEGGGFNGWLLVQHADLDRDFQREVLPMIEAKLGAPGVTEQTFAYLYDRVAVADERPQRYGTQATECNDGVAGAGPLEDAENIDAVRASIGLEPLAAYMARLSPCGF